MTDRNYGAALLGAGVLIGSLSLCSRDSKRLEGKIEYTCAPGTKEILDYAAMVIDLNNNGSTDLIILYDPQKGKVVPTYETFIKQIEKGRIVPEEDPYSAWLTLEGRNVYEKSDKKLTYSYRAQQIYRKKADIDLSTIRTWVVEGETAKKLIENGAYDMSVINSMLNANRIGQGPGTKDLTSYNEK